VDIIFFSFLLSVTSKCVFAVKSSWMIHIMMMEAETLSEMLDAISVLTWLIAEEDLIAFSQHESLVL
jgi:hypothetical protein